ncbi:MAG: molybdopterin-dependent oxidoreductase [Pirellulaceae bacterium]|nr:molybdopterin-dependent oxidoreductase [Pirellulaceae bacterium]
MSNNSDGSLPRRTFVQGTAVLAASLAAGPRLLRAADPQAAPTVEKANPHPFLTPAEDFYTVARGNPKPHTLTGDALADARLTADTWRLEIEADPFVEEPLVKVPATLERPRTIADGTALDMQALLELGRRHGVKYIKAMQCLNIPTPLGQGLWEGVPLCDLLRLCGKLNNVRRIYYRGFHNRDPQQIFQSSLSYTQAIETPPGELPVFLAYRLNGEPIPPVRGGPVRMIVPWSHGFKSIKWLQHIFVTNDYRANDTYALQNNDPESTLKTAAYVDAGPEQVVAGRPVVATGQVISGASGVLRVEAWLRAVGDNPRPLADDDPELLRGPWRECQLLPPPDWSSVLPAGVSSRELLGFDEQTGQPSAWPPRYGMASWSVGLGELSAGKYELRARAVDRNGFAQPEPRPQQKSGRNGLQVWRFSVL